MSKTSKNQQGVISLIVTLIIVMMISVIILAFGNFTRREQVQTFDRQLSSEAYYAAESGINEAVKLIEEAQRSSDVNTRRLLTEDKDECKDMPPGYNGTDFNYDLDGTGNVQFSCLLLDPTPESIEFTNIDTGEVKVFPVQRATGGNISEVDIWWHYADVDSTPDFGGCQTNITLPQDWYTNCDAGMLRIDYAPASTAGFSESSLGSGSRTIYIKPTRNSAAPASVSVADGDIVYGHCYETPVLSANKPKYCRVRLSIPPVSRYYFRLTSLYLSTALTLCSSTCIDGPTRYELSNAQAQVDSTGKASDIVHRIQARVDISGLDGPFPSFAIESVQDVCKQISIAPPDDVVDSAGGCSRGWQ